MDEAINHIEAAIDALKDGDEDTAFDSLESAMSEINRAEAAAGFSMQSVRNLIRLAENEFSDDEMTGASREYINICLLDALEDAKKCQELSGVRPIDGWVG